MRLSVGQCIGSNTGAKPTFENERLNGGGFSSHAPSFVASRPQ